MSQELKLLPCPNPKCGSTDMQMLHTGDLLSEFQVTCNSCQCSGPLVFNCPRKAIAAWNAIPRALTWTTEPPTTPGTYGIIRKDKTATLHYYFVTPNAEDCADIAHWIGPLPPVFSILCDMGKEPKP